MSATITISVKGASKDAGKPFDRGGAKTQSSAENTGRKDYFLFS